MASPTAAKRQAKTMIASLFGIVARTARKVTMSLAQWCGKAMLLPHKRTGCGNAAGLTRSIPRASVTTHRMTAC
jgi:hypothetical protein